MGRAPLDFVPRLMSAPDAARYIGISETYLRTLGLPRRILGKRRTKNQGPAGRYVSEKRYGHHQRHAALHVLRGRASTL